MGIVIDISQMPQKTLTDLFPNATQSATDITLTKADLQLTSAIVTADQFIAAIAIKIKPILTQDNFDQNFDQNIYCSDGFDSFTTKNDGTNDVRFVVRQIILNLAKQDDQTMNPEDY